MSKLQNTDDFLSELSHEKLTQLHSLVDQYEKSDIDDITLFQKSESIFGDQIDAFLPSFKSLILSGLIKSSTFSLYENKKNVIKEEIDDNVNINDDIPNESMENERGHYDDKQQSDWNDEKHKVFYSCSIDKSTIEIGPDTYNVFVGDLVQDITEEELNDIFKYCGEISEIKVIRDNNTGLCKGYAFIHFVTREGLEKSLTPEFNGKIIKNRPCRINPSDKKNQLFVGNLSKDLTQEQVRYALSHLCDPITSDFSIKMINSQDSKRCCFVKFSSYAIAEACKKILTNSIILDQALNVNWAEDNSVNNSKTLQVHNLAESVREDQLRTFFAPHGTIHKVVIVKDQHTGEPRGYAYVEFKEKESAINALNELNNSEFAGRKLTIVLHNQNNRFKQKMKGWNKGSNFQGGGGFQNGGYQNNYQGGGGFQSGYQNNYQNNYQSGGYQNGYQNNYQNNFYDDKKNRFNNNNNGRGKPRGNFTGNNNNMNGGRKKGNIMNGGGYNKNQNRQNYNNRYQNQSNVPVPMYSQNMNGSQYINPIPGNNDWRNVYMQGVNPPVTSGGQPEGTKNVAYNPQQPYVVPPYQYVFPSYTDQNFNQYGYYNYTQPTPTQTYNGAPL